MSLDDLRSSVLEVPGVVALHGGAFGEAGTYLPGKRIPGLRRDGADVRIHVVMEFGYDVSSTASQIRLALARQVAGDVHVVVEDVVEPGSDLSHLTSGDESSEAGPDSTS